MFTAGMIMALAGAGGVVGSLINASQLNYFSSSTLVRFMISFLLFAIGVLLIVFSVIKKRNKDRLDPLRGLTGDGEKQAVCSSCGLNVAPGVTTCPKCGNTITLK